MIKVYKMNGKTEVHEIFTSPSGKTTYKVTFSKGNLDPKNRVPAKYATSSPVIQHVIEHSPKFGKTIFLDRVYGNSDPAPAKVAPAKVAPAKVAPKKVAKKAANAEEKSKLKEMPEATTLADAVTVLVSEGVLAADFDGTVECAQRIAKSLGISFPNLVEE